MLNKPIKAVLFDLGDTLLNFGMVKKHKLFRESVRRSYEFLQSLNQPVGSFRIYSLRNLLSLYWHSWLSYMTKNDFDSFALLKKVNGKTGVRLTDRQWEHLIWLWYEPVGELAKTEPDIIETLTKLRNMGMKLGIFSNTFVHYSVLDNHLRQIGIVDLFDVRMYSYQFGFRKPDAKAFKTSAERIGEDLENILYVGDRIENDIEPTLKLGMHAALKASHYNEGKKTPEGAWKITDVAELPEMIEKYNAEMAELRINV